MKGKKVFLAFVIVSFVISAAGQRYTRSEYIRKYQLLAISEMNRSGIPASIKMAQACLESADGNSEMARKSNNHFGIKCKRNWTGDKGQSGSVAVGPYVRVNLIDCRDFTNTVTINGQSYVKKGTACREADGHWTVSATATG